MSLLISQGQAYLRSQSIDQWQNNYPNPSCISQDIECKRAYITKIDDIIASYVVLDFEEEKAYQHLLEGSWLSTGSYSCIHRFTIHEHFRGRGLAKTIFEKLEDMTLSHNVFSIRCDTHENNFIMRKIFASRSFSFCGYCRYDEGHIRCVYEKLLTP